MSERIRIILDGPLEDIEWMLKTGLAEREALAREWLKLGHGWGFSSKGRSAFFRKIKGGFSATVPRDPSGEGR